jgi:AraC-like DNA-binding protein
VHGRASLLRSGLRPLYTRQNWVWSGGGVASQAMVYREQPLPEKLRGLVECAWVRDGPIPESARVLPDGCMDLILADDRIVVAGPDTTAFVSYRNGESVVGLRFRPGVLPRLLGVPACELLNNRVPLDELRVMASRPRSLIDVVTGLAADRPRTETAPWSLRVLDRVTRRLAAGTPVADVAGEIGWSPRTLQRQCAVVYGYSPATLRRILRFRRAVLLLNTGLTTSEVAARAGYADQPHLHREVRALAGLPPGQLVSDANKSTEVLSGSSTVA